MANRRIKYAEGLSPLYLPIYEKLCQILPPHWQPYCGYRSFPEQRVLFDKGRIMPGPIVTNAPPGCSPHNYGCASDWTVFDVYGKPVWLEAKDPAWSEYSNACRIAGAKWGIKLDSKSIDHPHNELPLRVKWSDVYDYYVLEGTESAMNYVATNIIPL